MRRTAIAAAVLAVLAAAPAYAETLTHSEEINVWGKTPLTQAIERAVERTSLQADPAPAPSATRRTLGVVSKMVRGALIGAVAGAAVQGVRGCEGTGSNGTCATFGESWKHYKPHLLGGAAAGAVTSRFLW